MHAFLHLAKTNPRPGIPVQAVVPELHHAELAAVYYDQRMAGDYYDFLRVSPTRVLFALLDVAGRVAENREVVSAAQGVFRSLGAELFAQEAVNEADAMVDLCLELNRTILKTAAGHGLLLQCRSHSRSAAGWSGSHRTPCYRLAPGTVFTCHF